VTYKNDLVKERTANGIRWLADKKGTYFDGIVIKENIFWWFYDNSEQTLMVLMTKGNTL